MKDFWYYVPTRVNFGPSCFQYLVDTIHQWGTKPLIVYGWAAPSSATALMTRLSAV